MYKRQPMDFENLHQILRSLYDEMMPLCSDMTDIAKAVSYTHLNRVRKIGRVSGFPYTISACNFLVKILFS